MAAPFALTSLDEIRTDATVTWADFSTTHGTAVPASTGFTPSDGGSPVTVSSAGGLFIHSQGGLSTPGVLLGNNSQPMSISLGGDTVQGISFIVEHLSIVQAEYSVSFFAENGDSLGTIVTPSPGDRGNPAFIGFVDPDARIASFTVDSTPSNRVAITNLTLQRRPPAPALDSLPVASSVTLEISPNETYLHQGLSFFSRRSTETTTAVADNDNTFDLLALFPTLRPGDVIRFQRSGIIRTEDGINNLAAALSSSETLLAGDEFTRIPSVIPVGSPIITPSISNRGIPTPTDIAGDFIVPDSAFITLPGGARYLFTSLQQPSGRTAAPNLRLSHIPRRPFLEWIASLGLVGPLADPSGDLDGDGLSLLEEFAFAKDPTFSDAGAQDFSFTPFIAAASPRLRLNIGVRRDAPLRYLPEYSEDLVIWETQPETSLSTLTTAGGRAILTTSDPIGGPRRFGRIRIELIPPPF